MDFIAHLLDLSGQSPGAKSNRAALAALRRGLGKPPGTEPEMHRYVLHPRVSLASNDNEEDVRYLVAALFALHTENTTEPGNLGQHVARLSAGEAEPAPAVERRFNALLDSRFENLYRTLPPLIRLLKSKNVKVNWARLLNDLKQWQYPDSRHEVQRRWAQDFWSEFHQAQPEDDSIVNDEVESEPI